MVVLEFSALVSSILYIEVMDLRAQYPQCVTLESFTILKSRGQHGLKCSIDTTVSTVCQSWEFYYTKVTAPIWGGFLLGGYRNGRI